MQWPTALFDWVEASVGPDDIGDRKGRLPLRLQLATAAARELAAWRRRRKKALTVGRDVHFESFVRRRLVLLTICLQA